MNISAPLRLARYLSDAARLRREISPHELDRLGPEGAGGISYAVDTNIVSLYLRPNKAGPRSERGDGGYGVVFHDDPLESSAALGAVLSRFIFYDLTDTDTPMILLPGHDAEVRGMYEAVLTKAQRFLDEVNNQRTELRAILEEIAKIGDLEGKVEVLQSKTPDLLSYLYYSTNAAVELSRFGQLIIDGRIRRLAFALERWSKFSDERIADSHEMRQAHSVPITIQDQITESFFRTDWKRRLHRENPKRRLWQLRPDCAALARLELINLRLRQHGHGRRLVLITGDEAMFRAAAQYTPIPENPATFSELYLRHPRAFLATPMVVLSAPCRGGTDGWRTTDFVTDWLETLLARYTDDAGVDDARLQEIENCSADLADLAKRAAGSDVDDRNLNMRSQDFSESRQNALTLIQRAKHVVEIDPGAPDRIKSEWNKHFKQLVTEHAGASHIGRAAIRQTLDAALKQNIDTALDDLNRLLSDRIDQTWAEFYRALVVAGLELLLEGGPKDEARKLYTRKRSPPPIVIQSSTWAVDFVRRLAGTSDVLGTFRREAECLESLVEDDPSGYMQSLVFALVFANAEKWHIATLLSRRAISIARRIQGEQVSDTSTSVENSVSGREAFYLCSFAVRLRARMESDLQEAEALLGGAEEALRQEHARNQCLSVSMIRFDAERLALELERCLLLRFGDAYVPGRERIGSLVVLFDRFTRLYSDLETERNDWLREHLRRRILTNTFMVAALIESDGPLPPNVSVFCEAQYGSLTSVETDPRDGAGESIPRTRLVSAVADYAVARFARPKESSAISRIYRRTATLQQAVADGDETVLLTWYDRQRFSLLIARTLSALSSRE